MFCKARSSSNASSEFGDYDVHSSEYAEYFKAGISELTTAISVITLSRSDYHLQSMVDKLWVKPLVIYFDHKIEVIPLKHERACQIIERQIDYETEYAEYELSKDWETSKKRTNISKMLVIFAVLLILSGKNSQSLL